MPTATRAAGPWAWRWIRAARFWWPMMAATSFGGCQLADCTAISKSSLLLEVRFCTKILRSHFGTSLTCLSSLHERGPYPSILPLSNGSGPRSFREGAMLISDKLLWRMAQELVDSQGVGAIEDAWRRAGLM